MGLGYRGNKNWRDMSDYLVSLVKSPKLLHSILADERLPEHEKPLGALWNHDAAQQRKVFPSQYSACLSEIPLDCLGRLVERHGDYGVVVSRQYAQSEGAARVWYLEAGTGLAETFFKTVGKNAFERKWKEIDKGQILWKLTPFVDYLTDGTETKARREFDWEREWRVVDGLTLPVGEVSLVVAPESKHADFSSYGVTLVDLSWDDERLQGVFQGLPHPKE